MTAVSQGGEERAIADAARELVELRDAWLNPLPNPPPVALTGEGSQ